MEGVGCACQFRGAVVRESERGQRAGNGTRREREGSDVGVGVELRTRVHVIMYASCFNVQRQQ